MMIQYYIYQQKRQKKLSKIESLDEECEHDTIEYVQKLWKSIRENNFETTLEIAANIRDLMNQIIDLEIEQQQEFGEHVPFIRLIPVKKNVYEVDKEYHKNDRYGKIARDLEKTKVE